MLHMDEGHWRFEGAHGTLEVPTEEVIGKLAMLIEGECEGLGAAQAARKFGYSSQRYYQLLSALQETGADGLKSAKRGPKTDYRRTPEVVRQVIRHRFMDLDASPEVIAQKLRQCGCKVSTRSVERVIAQYGIQKKTLRVPSRHGPNARNPAHPSKTPA